MKPGDIVFWQDLGDDTDLRRLAEAATPGPWSNYTEAPAYGIGPVSVVFAGAVPVADCRGFCNDQANVAYITAANPTAIIALDDELTALRKRVKELEGALVRARADIDRITDQGNINPDSAFANIDSALGDSQ